jgi:acid stress-induced BolA-like protein IbaG/YrbA
MAKVTRKPPGDVPESKASPLTRSRLERLLTERLSLAEPRFFLRQTGPNWVGNLVSPSFKAMGDFTRQEMIWNALEAELGTTAVARVGMLLAYTPEEWDLGSEAIQPRKRAKKAG